MRQKRTGQKIWKGNVFRRRLGAGAMVLLFILGMFFDQSSLMRVQAEEDSISVGTIRYDEDGVGYFSDATGTGTSLYHSIVISFTKQVSTTKTEQMLLPSVPGFV